MEEQKEKAVHEKPRISTGQFNWQPSGLMQCFPCHYQATAPALFGAEQLKLEDPKTNFIAKV